MCQIDVLCGKSLIIDFLENFFKKRTAIKLSTSKMFSAIFKIRNKFSSFLKERTERLILR